MGGWGGEPHSLCILALFCNLNADTSPLVSSLSTKPSPLALTKWLMRAPRCALNQTIALFLYEKVCTREQPWSIAGSKERKEESFSLDFVKPAGNYDLEMCLMSRRAAKRIESGTNGIRQKTLSMQTERHKQYFPLTVV